MHNSKTQLQESIMSVLTSGSQVWHPVEITMNLEEQGFEFSVAEVRSLLNALTEEGKLFEYLEGYMLLEAIAEDGSNPEDIAPSMFTDQDRVDYQWLTSIPKTAFVASGLAIASIRNKRLYRIEYDTFEEFCLKTLGCSRDTVYRQIVAAEIYCQLKNVDNLSTKSAQPGMILPTCESQVRPLTKFKPEKRIEHWQLAVKKAGGVPTAKIVKQVVREQEQMELSAKYRLEEDRLRCGTVVRISGKNNPGLKVFHNCWAEIVGVNENSYDLVAWNGAKKEVHRNDFTVLPKADPELARSLLTRLSRIRFQLEESQKDDVHLRGFLSYLGTQECPELTPWSEKILSQTEAVFESD